MTAKQRGLEDGGMAQVVLLSDVVDFNNNGMSRYMAPYTLASSLEDVGLDVAVIDYFTKKKDFFDYLENFLDSETLAVGLSSTFLNPFRGKNDKPNLIEASRNLYVEGVLFCQDSTSMSEWFAELRKRIQKKSPRARIFLGGTKTVRALYHKPADGPDPYTEIDYFCVGAGDVSFPNAVVALREGREPEVKIHSGKKVLTDVSGKVQTQVCPEARMRSRYAVQWGETLPIEISRGCIFNCKFCHYEKKESIRKDPAILKTELIRNYEKFGTTVYNFTDDCFNDHRQKVETYCEMFLSLPFRLEWISYARVDVAVKFPETARLMVESGARGLFWGLESFNEEVARRAGKGTPVEQVKAFLLDFHKRYSDRCLSAGSFIVGLPGEDAASIRKTIAWLCEHDVLDIVYVGGLNLAPYSANLDKVAVDYADYSRDPEKYGFKDIRFYPPYWKHEHMDSDEAVVLAREFYETWARAHNPGPIRSIWRYTHLRSLGFTPEEILAQKKRLSSSGDFNREVVRRFEIFLSRYFEQLVSEERSHQGALTRCM